MDRDPKPADAAHAMTTLLRYRQRKGRFGREVRGEHLETCETATAMGTDDPHATSYEVDAEAVAAAIVERLLAGRTLAPPRG
jgi:hypothetical protein